MNAELESDLRSTAESIVLDADRLRSIEEEKATLPIDDPRLADLSREAERIARRLVPKTAAESQLVLEAEADATS